jgi:protein-tyrosine phosphatase
VWTELHWVNGPWPGRLALAARPRGGDWLEDELAAWCKAGVDAVVSLLTPDEESDLELSNEKRETLKQGLEFFSLPIEDRSIPDKEDGFRDTVEHVNQLLSAGKKVAIRCRQGIGRTCLLTSCFLLSRGFSPRDAVAALSAARGVPVPETDEQRRWIDGYATNLAVAKQS